MQNIDTLFWIISSYNSYPLWVWRTLSCTQTIKLLWKEALSTKLELHWKLLKSVWIWRTGVFPNLIQEIIPYFDVHWPPIKSTGHYTIMLHAEKAPCGMMNWLPGTQPHKLLWTVKSIITDIKRYEVLTVSLTYISK